MFDLCSVTFKDYFQATLYFIVTFLKSPPKYLYLRLMKEILYNYIYFKKYVRNL